MTAATFRAEGVKFSIVFPVSDHLTGNNNSMNWRTRCYNIIEFLGSTRDRIFSMGNTGFFLKLTFQVSAVTIWWCHPIWAKLSLETTSWAWHFGRSLTGSLTMNNLLLDEVCVISRIIKVEVGVISRSQRLRLTFTETLIILDITKIESNNCFAIHWAKRNESHVFLRHWQQATQSAKTWHDYP